MQDPPNVEDVIIKLETNLPVCRVCLNISMEYIEFGSTLCLVNGIEVTYSDGFNIIAPNLLRITEKLPTSFCSSCGSDLLNAYLFHKRVENANIILDKMKDYMETAESTKNSESENEDEAVDSDTNARFVALSYTPHMATGTNENEDNLKIDEKTYVPQDHANDELSSGAEEMFIDIFLKEEEGDISEHEPEVRSKTKMTRIDESWPPSPKNSLYTDSDCESSENIVRLHEVNDNKFKEPTIWMCIDCGEICMSRRMLQIHRKHHKVINNSNNICTKCDKPLDTIEELDNHLCFHKFSELISIGSNNLFHRCKLCERKYRSEADFIDHMNIHKDKKPYKCNNCTNTFHTKHHLRLHTIRFHRNSERKVKTIKRANIEKKEKCPHCYKMVRKSFMEIHKEVHFGPRNSMCTECGKQFGSRLALRTHTLIHKQRGEFPCHICNKICQTVYALKSHIQFKHLMDKSLIKRTKFKYQCEDCGLVFQYPSKLRVHQRKHNAEAPFKCPHCNRSYLRKDQFKTHMRYHNNDLPYKCDRCDKRYATKNNLSEHTKSVHDHVTYGCDKCNQKFKSVTGLRKHKFLHTGYPYVCPMCGMGQPFRSGIKAHLLRVHKDTFTEEEFNETFPVVVPKSGFRRPKA